MSNYIMSIQVFGDLLTAETDGSRICLNDIFRAGNAMRMAEGKAALQMSAFLNSKSVEEYIKAAALEWGHPEDYFVVKKGKGKNTKTLVHVSIALLAAESMNPRFHAHIHRTFIEGKLLEFRERGGTEFVKLNASIDENLPGREGKSNKGVFIQVAKRLRDKILGESAVAGDWDKATVAQTHMRYDVENKLSEMLRLNLVRDYDHLKEIINKL